MSAVMNIRVMKTRIVVFVKKVATPTVALRYRGHWLLRHSNNMRPAMTVEAMTTKCSVMNWATCTDVIAVEAMAKESVKCESLQSVSSLGRR